MKKLLFAAFVLFFTYSVCFSQTREKLEMNKSYELAKIYTKKNQIFKGRNLTLINDSTISYKNKSTYKEESLNINDLRSLKVKSGTKVVPYALYGAGFMALVSLQAWADIQSDPYRKLKSNAGEIFGGFIAGGAVVGAMVGMATPKWKGISIPRKTPGATSFYLNPAISVQKDYCVLSLNLKF
jgi:hypothetical protein